MAGESLWWVAESIAWIATRSNEAVARIRRCTSSGEWPSGATLQASLYVAQEEVEKAGRCACAKTEICAEACVDAASMILLVAARDGSITAYGDPIGPGSRKALEQSDWHRAILDDEEVNFRGGNVWRFVGFRHADVRRQWPVSKSGQNDASRAAVVGWIRQMAPTISLVGAEAGVRAEFPGSKISRDEIREIYRSVRSPKPGRPAAAPRD